MQIFIIVLFGAIIGGVLGSRKNQVVAGAILGGLITIVLVIALIFGIYLFGGEFIPVFFLAVIPGAVVGGFLGSRKNQVGAGVLLGGLFSLLGWIITLCLPDLRPKCPSCRGPLPDPMATRCRHCGQSVVYVATPTSSGPTALTPAPPASYFMKSNDTSIGPTALPPSPPARPMEQVPQARPRLLEKRYLVAKDGQEIGRFTVEEVRSHLAAGTMEIEDFWLDEERNEWRAIMEKNEFTDL